MTGKINQDNEPCELLAPAGGLSSAMAAFEYGADAIYLGFKKFSARSGAENFTYEEILSVIKQAKSYDKTKKVYVAINTLVKNDEIDELIKLLSFAEDAKFDGVILQDLGVFHLIKNYFSNLALHASTQMAVHNLEGALALKDLGFERVVLARELSLEEIEYITKNCGIETEVFIHGALCYGYSGLCFTSSFEVGLSANRGRCAYPCRDEYTRTGDKKKLGHIFSLKDFALEKRVLDLKKAGVASLKIEGRKKGSVYVAAVTDYYRKILDGNFQDDKLNYLRDNIKTIFSRKQTKLLFEKDKNFNAIDIEKSGHRGLFLSKIENVIKKGKKTLILFKTNRKIEKYDGLQIDIKGYGKPYGFSAQEFWEKTRNNNYKNVFFVLKNKKAIVTLPKNAPDINIGDKIYLSSSQKVKSDYLLSKKTFKEAFA
jgi:putative protease